MKRILLINLSYLIGCVPLQQIPVSGFSIIALPEKVWITPDLPCPYDERGIFEFNHWLPITNYETQWVYKRSIWELTSDSGEINQWFRNYPIWELINKDVRNELTNNLTTAKVDALINTTIEINIVQVTELECLDLSNYGCDWDENSSMPMVSIRGIAINWLCTDTQLKPK